MDNGLRFEPREVTTTEDRKKISNVIMNEFQQQFATELLNIGDIEAGEAFKGICYVSDMKMIRNASDKDKYDGRFELIDGQGRRVRATYWGMPKKFETHNSLAYVEGVFYTVGNPGTTRKVYRIDRITQSTVDIPKHVFFKNIDNLEGYKSAVESEINKIVDPIYRKITENLKNSGILNDLEIVPFDDFYYTEIGSRLKIYTSILMDAVNFHKIKELNFDLLRVGLLLRLWDPQTRLISDSGREVHINVNYTIEKELYGMDLPIKEFTTVMSFVKKDGLTFESIFVEKSIDKYFNLLVAHDGIVDKVDDIILY